MIVIDIHDSVFMYFTYLPVHNVTVPGKCSRIFKYVTFKHFVVSDI